MSNELHINAATGKTIYIVRFNTAGQVALSDGSAFEDWGAGGHDADDYDVAASEVGSSGHYAADFDSSNNIAGVKKYFWRAHDQAGGNPADSDPVVDSGEIIWAGNGELTAEKILANKAVQNKSTGAIDYYDDDGQSVILTHTPTDVESSVTRTPG